MKSDFSEKNLHEIIKTAIEKEKQAQALYREAAELATDYPSIAEQFRRFEQDEKVHEQQLMESYAKLKALLDRK